MVCFSRLLMFSLSSILDSPFPDAVRQRQFPASSLYVHSRAIEDVLREGITAFFHGDFFTGGRSWRISLLHLSLAGARLCCGISHDPLFRSSTPRPSVTRCKFIFCPSTYRSSPRRVVPEIHDQANQTDHLSIDDSRGYEGLHPMMELE